jgi:aldehyde dehydrogenase (NAD+)
VEIFGPVVVLMTFRTPEEAVELANDTRYGLAASVWTESVNLALDVAPKVKAGTVWVNCTNLFDAASGFGGYRESGYGREGGEEGLWEYVRPTWERVALRERNLGARAVPRRVAPTATPPPGATPAPAASTVRGSATPPVPPIDRTAKHYIGGKQVRPDAEYTLPVPAADGRVLGEVGRGNRKDVRNAVEAARAAQASWAARPAHQRAQILYYLAENLEARGDELTMRLADLSGDADDARTELEATLERLFTYAAWADKWEGRVHPTPLRNVTLAMKEPMGVMGCVCPDERPLLAFVACVAPLVAVGNSVVAVPSEPAPLLATDLYQVLETSDVPAGVVNIVTGLRAEVVPTLAAHDDVDGIWYFGPAEGSAEVERASTGNMKRTWVSHGMPRSWLTRGQGWGEEFLREATQVKNVWVPYGE